MKTFKGFEATEDEIVGLCQRLRIPVRNRRAFFANYRAFARKFFTNPNERRDCYRQFLDQILSHLRQRTASEVASPR